MEGQGLYRAGEDEILEGNMHLAVVHFRPREAKKRELERKLFQIFRRQDAV